MRRDLYFVAMIYVVGLSLFLIGALIFVAACPPAHDCQRDHPWTAVCPTAQHWNAHVGKP